MTEEKKKRGRGRALGQKLTKPQSESFSETKLDSLDQEMLRLEQTRPGLTHRTMAKVVGAHEMTIGRRRKRDIYQSAMKEISKGTMEIIKDNQRKAARVLGDLLKDPSSKIRLEAARILSRPLLPNTVDVRAEVSGDPDLKRMSIEQLQEIAKNGVKSIDGSNRKPE